MKFSRVKRLTSFILICTICLTCGCTRLSFQKTVTPGNSVSGLYFDTAISITAYDDTSLEVLKDTLGRCEDYELIFSRTNENSELYAINHRTGGVIEGDKYTVEVSEDMYNVLNIALKYSKETELAFNPTLGSVIKLWDYHSDNPVVPSEVEIEKALKFTNPYVMDISGELFEETNEHYLSLPMDETIIDLGAIAKGYIADELKDYLQDKGCREAVITLGGNVYCIGCKGGAGYTVGIQKPFDSKGATQMTVNISDSSVVTSGIYERYFETDGKIYHHIIDGSTGYPVDNELASVTVICSDSMKADVLSTALLCMGSEKGLEYAKRDPSIHVIMITRDGEVLDSERNG